MRSVVRKVCLYNHDAAVHNIVRSHLVAGYRKLGTIPQRDLYGTFILDSIFLFSETLKWQNLGQNHLNWPRKSYRWTTDCRSWHQIKENMFYLNIDTSWLRRYCNSNRTCYTVVQFTSCVMFQQVVQRSGKPGIRIKFGFTWGKPESVREKFPYSGKFCFPLISIVIFRQFPT